MKIKKGDTTMKELTIIKQDAFGIEDIPYSIIVTAILKNNRTNTEGIHFLIGDGFDLVEFIENNQLELKGKNLRFAESVFGNDVLIKDFVEFSVVEDLICEGIKGEEDEFFSDKKLNVKFPVLFLKKN